MCKQHENEMPDLQAIWAAADKRAKDWREAGEVKLLNQLNDALQGLKSLGWLENGRHAPNDGTKFLAIELGSTGIFPCYFRDGFWIEAHGDLWPARPALWKPMPSNDKVWGAPRSGASQPKATTPPCYVFYSLDSTAVK